MIYTTYLFPTITPTILTDWPKKIAKEPEKVADTSLNETELRGVFDKVERVSFEQEDTQSLDQKLREWLLQFYKRQRTMADIYRVVGFQVDEDLAMRQKIGRMILKARNP